MPDWLRVAAAVFSTYRAAQLISIDDGPWGMFQWLRDIGGVYDRGRDGQPVSQIGRLLACPYCNGLYLALLFGALALAGAWWSDLILLVFGIAGAQCYLQGARKPR